MINKPLVSVVTIFLNAEKFIEEAILSAIAQTYDNWELLLVDDGSTDASTQIALRYAEKYPQMRYLEHENHQNLGMSAARNLGICNTKGKYVSFLDSDDVWLPHKLEQQVALMESQPLADLVCGCSQWWYSWTGNPEDAQRDFVQKLDVPLNTLIQPPALLTMFLQNEWASIHDLLVRREVIEAVGGYEDEFRGMYEDQAFHAKLCLNSPAFVSSHCWCRYRQHPNACTSVSHKEETYYSARQAFLSWLEAYLSKQGAKNTEVWRIVQKEVWPFRYPLLALASKRIQPLIKEMKSIVKQIGRRTLPVGMQSWLLTQWHHKLWPPVGWVRFGTLRRVTPIGKVWPNHRGLPIDRYYIEKFLALHAHDVQGHVLELGDASYTWLFGGDRITQSDVLHASDDNPLATIVADLTCAEHIPSDTFDCIILTQSLLLIYDLSAAIKTIHRILKPGGVVLATVPGITQIIRDDMEAWGQYWSFTTMSAQRLFAQVFPSTNIQVEAHGNVLAVTAFMYGLATQELRSQELDYQDPDYELIITIRAVKPEVTP